MFVEVHFAIMLAHVDFKLLRSTPPLPPVIFISHAKVALGSGQHEPFSWEEFEIQVTEQQSAEVGKVATPPVSWTAPTKVKNTMPQTKYLALIWNGSGNIMISLSPYITPNATSKP